MNKLFYIISVITILVFSQSCKEKKKQSISITKEIIFKKEGELLLKKAETDSVIKRLDIEIAETEYETQTGLMYRHIMENNQAMLFVFKNEQPRSFYMKNTEFSLDIIYINNKKEIVSIQKNTKPYDEVSLPSNAPVLYVLEINGGLSDSWGIKTGDVIEWK
tara:strand:+ start:4717 stop:5202 length:486 start_codon:yes stop_codon:yes gene_type:complete